MDTIWQENGSLLSSGGTANTPIERSSIKRVRQFTIASDLILINLGFYLAYLARYTWQWFQAEPDYYVTFAKYGVQLALINLFLMITFSQTSVWRRKRGEAWLDEVYRIGVAMALSFTLIMAFQYLFRPEASSRAMMLWTIFFIGGFLSLARLARRWSLQWLYSRGHACDNVIVVGSAETGRGVIRTLLARPDLGYNALGYLDDGIHEIGSNRIPHLGKWSSLERIIANTKRLHTVFIAMPADRHAEILEVTKLCLENGVYAKIVPDLFQLSLGRVEMDNMGGIPVIGVRNNYKRTITQFIKRVIDLIVVGIFSVPALIVGGLIALAIKLDDGGPIFYRATRIGIGGEPFKMYKFRSMVLNADKLRDELWEQNEADGPIFKIKHDPRITKVGRFIRKTSFDELPQFLNILLGDMSFVGPRPPIQDEVDQYSDWHHRRLEVKGGLTGLWQVSGRSDLTFDEMCLLDTYYMENWSLMMDLRIVLQTIPYVLLRRGAY